MKNIVYLLLVVLTFSSCKKQEPRTDFIIEGTAVLSGIQNNTCEVDYEGSTWNVYFEFSCLTDKAIPAFQELSLLPSFVWGWSACTSHEELGLVLYFVYSFED